MTTMLDWGLTAAAAFLFLYALRVLFVGGKKGETAKLGCSFGLAAGVLWTYVLSRHTDDLWTPLRVGVGVLLVLPAAQALAKPHGLTLLRGVIGLVLAFVIAGPAVQTLWGRWAPDGRPKSVRQLADKLDEMREARASLSRQRELLADQRATVREKVRGHGSTWEELSDDEDALRELERLRLIEERLFSAENMLATLDAKIPLAEAQLAAATEETEAPATDPELEALLRDLENAPALDELPTVEQYKRKAELQELFEREF